MRRKCTQTWGLTLNTINRFHRRRKHSALRVITLFRIPILEPVCMGNCQILVKLTPFSDLKLQRQSSMQVPMQLLLELIDQLPALAWLRGDSGRPKCTRKCTYPRPVHSSVDRLNFCYSWGVLYTYCWFLCRCWHSHNHPHVYSRLLESDSWWTFCVF